MKKISISISEKLKSIPSAVKSSVAGVGLLGLAANASAADYSATIDTAFSDATTSLGTVATGVILLAAAVTGVGLIVKFLSR